MKRRHEEIGKSSVSLGALEFASTLNGDDARATLEALVCFRKTIRRERRQALSRHSNDSSSSDDSSTSEEEDGVNDESLTKKRKKKETWMEDTESFNVPFVGTSVAKGDTGTVVKGQWPTGLLQAYLKASPMAVELSSDDLIPPSGHVHKKLLSVKSKHGKKASQAIYRAYLEALAELITAHVPILTLERDFGIESNDETHDKSSTPLTKDSLVSVILRDRLAGLMTLINEESGGGKLMDRGLVAAALKVLANLAATSIGAAREVTRALDASLKDGVLKSMLRERKTVDNNKNDESQVEKRDDRVRNECLRLAAVLAEWNDAAITSYITTKGSRERKINAGILYLAVRQGLQDSVFENGEDEDADEYMAVVTRLLCALGSLLPDANRSSARRRPLMSTRELVDFFSGEALVHISQMATCAPPLADSDSFRQVLAGTDLPLESTLIEDAGMESRRILFAFLADPARSPFLSRMNQSKPDDKLVAHCAQMLVRTMMLLLKHQTSLSMQRFLIHCMQTTPSLVQHFFKTIPLPDLKQTFAFIARMGFLFRLMREAPSVSCCMEGVVQFDAEHVEKVVSSIIPANLKKHILSKALQSTNALVVSEALKLQYALIDRYRAFLDDVKGKTGQEFRDRLAEAFVRRLPDLQPLLSVRSRFDPFAMGDSAVKASTAVAGHVCKVLDSYACCLPDVLGGVKFDWTKLLPASAQAFCSASPVLQFQLLQTLENILTVHEEHAVKHLLSAAAIRTVLDIVMAASQTQVYQKARSVALRMILSPSSKSIDAETRESIDYETSLWIDGLTEECADEFCSLVNNPMNNGFQHGMTIAKAWKSTGFDAALPPICFSPLLTTSLAMITTASEPFVLFTCQVLTKSLLYQRHPLPLASLIVNKLADVDLNATPANLLCRYAENLLALADNDAQESLSMLASLLKCLYSDKCLQSLLMRSFLDATDLDLAGVHFSEKDVAAGVRQCLHVAAFGMSDSTISKQSVGISQLRRLIPLLSQQSKGAGSPSSPIDTVLEHPILTSERYPWTELAFLNTAASLSLSGMTKSAADSTDGGECEQLFAPDAMPNLLLFALLNPLLPHDVASRRMCEVLRLVRQAAERQDPLMLSSFISLALYCIEKRELAGTTSSFAQLEAVLDTWLTMIENCEPDDSTSSLIHHLEALLSQAMCTQESEDGSFLYALLMKSPPSEIVQNCIRSKQLTASSAQCGTKPCSFLSSLIVADPLLFGVGFLKNLALPKEKSLLERGFFDEEIAMLSKSNDLLATETFADVHDAVVTRALNALSIQPQRLYKGRSVDDGLVSLLSLPGVLQANRIDDFVGRACDMLRTKSKLLPSHDNWFRLSYTLLCTDNSECGLQESSKRGTLVSILLLRAFQRLQSSLKSHFRSPTPESSSESGQACLESLKRIADMITKDMTYDGSVLTHEGAQVATGVIKTSLKHGLTHAADEDNGVSERCLRLVRTLLVEASDPSSTLHALKSSCILLDPSTILTLVLSHSHFHEVMTSAGSEGQSSAAVLELVRLLLVCTSMSRDTVLFETDMWVSLLGAYNAGMSLVDITLRRLLCVYAEALATRGEASLLPCMENLKWKGTSRTSEENMSTSGWDWLANSLDIARIRATLSQFPVHDRIKADPIRGVEVWLEDSTGLNPNETTVLSDSSSSSDSSSDSSDVSMKEHSDGDDVGVKPENHVVNIDLWSGSGDDMRYSPAFILPLILGALENSLSRTGSTMKTPETDPLMYHESRDEQGETEDSPSVKEFVLLAQRLCEKGALSLALGSLCGECASLRKVAVATLGHIKKALDTKEARKLSTWRERPQLAMIVDSVQRGLAVRIAMRMDPNEAPSSLVVPKLPALSAVFLARAALIIVKPGDSMFGPMNRYFLRLDSGHGAFQDTNRMPAFISLFCSSSDEPGQARRERIWAMQLLKDSFVEAYCYRMVDSCHAPELLLTSFRSIETRQEDDQHDTERILLLDTLTALLCKGGRRAASHLIGRVGLLSWLRCQLVAGDAFHLLPSVQTRNAFLRLTSMSVKMGHFHLADESSDRHHLVMESKALISHIIMLYDDSISQGLFSASDHRGTSPLESLAALSCETLGALVRIVNELGLSEDLGDVQKCGISVAPATRMVQTIPQPLKQAAVASICTHPLCIDDSISEYAILFSTVVLSVLSSSEVDAKTCAAILKRVTLLMSLMMEKPLDSDCGILDALLACRPQCLRLCRELWFKCLEAFVGTCKTESSMSGTTLGICRDIIGGASSSYLGREIIHSYR